MSPDPAFVQDERQDAAALIERMKTDLNGPLRNHETVRVHRDDVALLLSLASRIAGLDEEREGELVHAYCAGAKDVHDNWQDDRDPCFKEAAYDYVAALPPKIGGKVDG